MVIVKTSYKFRAYPSQPQQVQLNRQMLLAKMLYNLLLEKSQEYFRDCGKTFTKYDMNKWITQLKRKNPEFREAHSQVLQNVADRVSKAYQNFFRRVRERKSGKKVKVGFPRFKAFVSSLTYPQYLSDIRKKTISLPKVGNVNFVNHREILGDVKTASVKKTKSGEWYITLSAERDDPEPFDNGKPLVGIDLGLKEFTVLSEGTKIANPRFSESLNIKAQRLQREISRRKKGGKNRRKSIIKFDRISEQITRKREDSLHKISHSLVNSYSLIAYEKLQVKNMVKNHHLARGIHDASWANFVSMLCYKAESAGCRAVAVNPKDTSRKCSGCGNVKEMKLSQRTYDCPNCGMSMDRDVNAAKNILDRATEGHSGSNASGDLTSVLGRQLPDASQIVESGTTLGVSR